MLKFLCHIIRISIHAPTRGATSSSKVGYASENISIHAPTRGATLISASRLPYHLNFNPRSYKRSDDEIIRNQFIEDISIHAPTRGATLKVFTLRINTLFQSTLLQEERHTFHPHRAFHQDFNPRSYKRSDFISSPSLLFEVISIHAPTRGATTGSGQ